MARTRKLGIAVAALSLLTDGLLDQGATLGAVCAGQTGTASRQGFRFSACPEA